MRGDLDFRGIAPIVAFYIIGLTSIATFLSDGLAKYYFYEGGGFYRYSLIVRGILQLLFIGHLLLFFSKKRLVLVISVILLLLFFLIGQYFLVVSYSRIDLTTNFIFLNRFFYPLVLGGVFLSIKKSVDLVLKLWTVFRVVLFVNSFLILIGLVFGVGFLKTFPGSFKFGYDGFIFAQNEASYIYIIGLLVAYYDTAFMNKRKIFFSFISLVSLLIGTKAIYLFLIFLTSFHFVYFFTYKKLAALTLVVFAIVKFLMTEKLLSLLGSWWSVFLNHYEQNGLINALLSGRDNFIDSKLLPMVTENWSLPNFLFGGHDFSKFYMEMGFFDLFLMFGIVGLIVYLSAYSYFVFPFFIKNKYWLFSASVLFIIVFTSGHFFESPVSATYVAFFSVYLKQMCVKRPQLLDL